MLVQPDPESAQAGPDTLAPLCGEAEFAELVNELVAEDAPKLFAVLQEYGERADGRIAAWGMAFPDHADVVGVDHGLHLRLQSPGGATRAFRRRPHVSARIVWLDPDPVSPGSQ